MNDTIEIYIPEQIEALNIVYRHDSDIRESLKNIARLYNRIPNNKSYSRQLKTIELNYDPELDSVYKIDFSNLNELKEIEFNSNHFYSYDIFQDWLVKLEPVRRYIMENDDITDDEKKSINKTFFDIKKELLKIDGILKKKEKDNPLAFIFGLDEEEDQGEMVDSLI